MGTTASERIALRIDTIADLAGVNAVKTSATELGAVAKQATAAAAEGQNRYTISLEQSREAIARAGGDMEKLKQELAAIIGQQSALGQAASQATAQIERQARATQQYKTPIGPTFAAVAGGTQLGPAFGFSGSIGPELGPATSNTRLAAEAEKSAAAAAREINKIPSSARTAANAIGLMSQAALNGSGSLSGMANAAGSVAFGISAMSTSAKVASSAAGIGALITVITVAIAATERLTRGAEQSKVAMDHIAGFNTRTLAAAKAQLDQLNAQIGAAADAASKASEGDLPGLPSRDARKANAVLDNLLEQRNALNAKIIELSRQATEEEMARRLAAIHIEAEAQTTAVGRYAAQLRAIEAERVEAIRTRSLSEDAANQRAANERRALDTEGAKFVTDLTEKRIAAVTAATGDVFLQRKNQELVAYKAELKALDERALATEAYKQALDDINARHELAVKALKEERALVNEAARAAMESSSDNLYTSTKGKLAQIEMEKNAQIKAGVDEVLATEAAEQKKRKLYRDTARAVADSLKSIQDITTNSHNARTKAIMNFVKNMRAVELGYEAAYATVQAFKEGAKAVQSAASGNFAGAALHAAAAVKFAATAAVAANEAGGGSSSGGGGGGAGGSGDGGTVFQGRDSSDGGAQTLILQTVNPYSKEVIGEAIYQINRAGVLKRPIPIAPTSGLVGVAA